jgi:hypothetical protein
MEGIAVGGEISAESYLEKRLIHCVEAGMDGEGLRPAAIKSLAAVIGEGAACKNCQLVKNILLGLPFIMGNNGINASYVNRFCDVLHLPCWRVT